MQPDCGALSCNKPIPIGDVFYYCRERAAEVSGLSSATIFRWTQAQVTSYGYFLNVIEYQGRWLIDERDIQ